MLNESLNLNQSSFRITQLLVNLSDCLLFTSWLLYGVWFCKFFNIILCLTGSFLSSNPGVVSLHYKPSCIINHHK